jgi:predicted ATPase
MVDRVAGGKGLPGEVLERIVARTDGVPLFLEELTRAVLESGLLRDEGERYALSGPVPALAVPATLYDSLLARLDRLAPVKEVAQIGAVIGREFSHALLEAVAPLPEGALRDALDRLVEAELIFRRGSPPVATYTFKHALVQDAAYGTLLRSKRQQLHARIAQALEGQLPETAGTEPELLAHHCAEAGLAEKAADYWLKAGQLALSRSAMAEAVAQLSKGLAVLESLPDGPARWRRELKLQVALGQALIAARGFAAPETGRAYARARELCEQLGGTPQLFPALYGNFVFHFQRAELAGARGRGGAAAPGPGAGRRGRGGNGAPHRRVRLVPSRQAGRGPMPAGGGARPLRPGAGPDLRPRLRRRLARDLPALALPRAARPRLPGAGPGAGRRGARPRP